MNIILDSNNFIKPTLSGDTLIYIIYENKTILKIDPYSSCFIIKNQNVLVITDGVQKNILQFSSNGDAINAVEQLNLLKEQITTTIILDIDTQTCSSTGNTNNNTYYDYRVNIHTNIDSPNPPTTHIPTTVVQNQILSYDTFSRTPIEGDYYILIYNQSGTLIMQIDPYSSTFMNKGSFVYIITDGKQNYQNSLQFSNEQEAVNSLSKLNTNKNYFINKITNVDFASNYYFLQHTGNTNLHINNLLSDALYNSNNASLSNPFVTILDIGIYSGDTKQVKISASDNIEGYLIDKISGSTYITLNKLNPNLNEILQIDVDLSDFYNKTTIDNNFL